MAIDFDDVRLTDISVKRPKTATPTERSMSWLRENGYTCDIVERWLPFARRRIDLFGFGDIFAFNHDRVVIIQCTTNDHMADRAKKIVKIPEARDWVNGPGREIWVMGWRKFRRPENGRFWRQTIRKLTLDYFDDFKLPRASTWGRPSFEEAGEPEKKKRKKKPAPD